MLKKENTKNIKVLYAEDDLTVQELTLNILSNFFDNITVVNDGQEGLDELKSNNYDLVISDINMPHLSGLEMIEQANNLDYNFYSIVITAYADQDTFLNSIKLGVKGYIVKPISVKQVIEVLKIAVDSINNEKNIKILQQYKDIVDKSSIVSKSDAFGNITFVNKKFCELSGYSESELIGKPHNVVRHPDMNSDAFKQMWATLKNKEIWTGQVQNKKKNGDSYYVDATICPILDTNENIIEYIALRNDITELLNPLKQLKDKILSSKFPLLVMMQIDNFSLLDNLYEEDTINEMLNIFEKIIYSDLPDGLLIDSIYNLGNGEYAILQVNDTLVSATSLELQLKQLQQNINAGIVIVDDYDFDFSVSISFATNKENLYKNVKQGLVHAIQTKQEIVFANDFTKDTQAIALKNSKTIKMIQTAIDNNNIISHFQAITNNKTMEIEKYESLVRLIDEDGKVISPFFFLDLSKESGHYKKITNIILENSFAALEKTDKEVSINLSALDIEDLETRNNVINLVTIHMQHAHRIVFELLEDEQIKDFEIVKDFISLVKTFGVQIAIDDFGAGVSNYERLLDYQPDILKIDACLIKNIDKDKYSRDVVETIQLFAWKQDIKTVAEFVSTPEILQVVKDIGINYSQGFLLGKPEPLPNK